jgi:hypothetical protein
MIASDELQQRGDFARLRSFSLVWLPSAGGGRPPADGLPVAGHGTTFMIM